MFIPGVYHDKHNSNLLTSMHLEDGWDGDRRNPNDCVVCGSILHELGAQQCHARPKVESGAAMLPTSGVCSMHHTVIWFSFHGMV